MILALDISVHSLGWAYGDGSPTGTEVGTQSFSNCVLDYGFLFSEYKNWLSDMIATYEPDIIAMEGTYPGIKGKAGYMLNNLNGITHTTAYIHDLDRREYAPTTIKKFMTGNGRADKQGVMEAVRERGFTISNDDEADAIAVLLIAYQLHQQTKGEEDV